VWPVTRRLADTMNQPRLHQRRPTVYKSHAIVIHSFHLYRPFAKISKKRGDK
jgi:hypothetical protein